ncbi:hypothetical protein CTAYLR_001915 [Chrysophaeum taylorii]|uniref:PX domain-containing protein n=1 Tax=Chrysophaeum taylorii TaxID=2483200 RepID=A0AAD7UAP3_9STRA|nr:hypothetical protein CTAYLR_001915 [Chrysophaeum taylorii]
MILSESPVKEPDVVDVVEEEAPLQEEGEAMETKAEEESKGVITEEEPRAPAPMEWRSAWQQAASQLASISMTVDRPEAVGNALSKHIVYRVRSRILTGEEQQLFEVQRRFSEFVTLRESLVKRYQGLLIPPIPPKVMSAVSKAESKLVQTRARVLSLFVERLSALPWTADDEVLRAFCADDNWAKKEETVVIHDSEASTTGRGRASWYAVLARAPAPPDAVVLERKLVETTGRLEALQGALEVAYKATIKAAAGCASRSDALGALCDGLASWRGESARWSALDQSADDVSAERAAGAVNTAVGKWSRHATREPTTVELTLGAAATWQALHVAAMRDLVSKRTYLIDDLRKEQRALAALRQQKAAGPDAATPQKKRFLAALKPSSTNAVTAENIDDLIDEAVKTQAEKERALDLHARALSYCELDRFRDEYARFATLAARSFFDTQAALASQAADVWHQASETLGPPQPMPHWMQVPDHLRLPSLGSIDDFEEDGGERAASV